MSHPIDDSHCFLGSGGRCRFFDDLPSNGFTHRTVFFAYDAKNPQIEAIKYTLRNLLDNLKLKLITFEDSNIPTGHYFCDSICQEIRRCAFVIADLGKWDSQAQRYNSNPNVTLEVGMAWGFRKKLICFTCSEDGIREIPSNFAGMDLLIYPAEFFGDNSKLSRVIQEIINDLSMYDPVTLVSSGEKYRELTIIVNKLDGQRYGVHRRLPTIALSEEDQKTRLMDKYEGDEAMVKKHFDYWKERKSIWENKKTTGYKTWAVFDKGSIEKHIRDNSGYGSPLKSNGMKKFIDKFIEYLDRDDFLVAFTEEPVQFTFQVVEDKIAWLYSIATEKVDSLLSGILFTSQGTVNSFQKIFSDIYQKTKDRYPNNCNKDSIKNWLNCLKDPYLRNSGQ
jgi:hypothetical protein